MHHKHQLFSYNTLLTWRKNLGLPSEGFGSRKWRWWALWKIKVIPLLCQLQLLQWARLGYDEHRSNSYIQANEETGNGCSAWKLKGASGAELPQIRLKQHWECVPRKFKRISEAKCWREKKPRRQEKTLGRSAQPSAPGWCLPTFVPSLRSPASSFWTCWSSQLAWIPLPGSPCRSACLHLIGDMSMQLPSCSLLIFHFNPSCIQKIKEERTFLVNKLKKSEQLTPSYNWGSPLNSAFDINGCSAEGRMLFEKYVF